MLPQISLYIRLNLDALKASPGHSSRIMLVLFAWVELIDVELPFVPIELFITAYKD